MLVINPFLASHFTSYKTIKQNAKFVQRWFKRHFNSPGSCVCILLTCNKYFKSQEIITYPELEVKIID